MTADPVLIASGLGFPEGPVWMPDGTLLCVELQNRRVDRIHPDGRVEVIAEPGGSPNGLAIGPDGAGHFVKMVHNGIEYADMQFIAETYDILRNIGGLSPQEIGDVFTRWNNGRLKSYLTEVATEVLAQVDAKTGKLKAEKAFPWPLYSGALGTAGDLVFTAQIDGKIMADSGLIIDHLERTNGHRLDGRLTLAQRAESLAIQRMLETTTGDSTLAPPMSTPSEMARPRISSTILPWAVAATAITLSRLITRSAIRMVRMAVIMEPWPLASPSPSSSPVSS